MSKAFRFAMYAGSKYLNTKQSDFVALDHTKGIWLQLTRAHLDDHDISEDNRQHIQWRAHQQPVSGSRVGLQLPKHQALRVQTLADFHCFTVHLKRQNATNNQLRLSMRPTQQEMFAQLSNRNINIYAEPENFDLLLMR